VIDGAVDPLATQNEMLRQILEGSRLGIWDWNPQTDQVAFDKRWAEMLGWSLDELEQNLESWSSRVHPDDLEQCFSDIQAHMDGKVDFYENIHRMRHRNGTWRYILDRGCITERNDEGKPVRFMGTHTDITAQKEAELEAVEAAMRQKRFLASMSHEIRTPLNGIVGIIDILDTYELPAPVREWVQLIAKSSDLLQTVVDDILDLSKMDANRLNVVSQPFNLPECLEQAVRLFSARAHRSRTKLSYIPSAELPVRVLGDRHRLQQIVMNLVSNAVKFTEGGEVVVSSSVDADMLTVGIADTGIGIADTNVIWEIYGQSSSSIHTNYAGTGLGLPIVKRLVGMLDGTVEVVSTVGKGSTFVVRVPIVRERTVGNVEEGPSCLSHPDIAGMSVLIAEDNPINRLVVKAMLDHFDCRSTMVVNGEDALKTALKHPFDLILMDVHMPVMDGVTATRTLRRSGCSTPIVALTADSMPENRQRCEEAGMDGFLSKPIRHNALLAFLSSL